MFDELVERSLMSPLTGMKHTYASLAIIIHFKKVQNERYMTTSHRIGHSYLVN